MVSPFLKCNWCIHEWSQRCDARLTWLSSGKIFKKVWQLSKRDRLSLTRMRHYWDGWWLVLTRARGTTLLRKNSTGRTAMRTFFMTNPFFTWGWIMLKAKAKSCLLLLKECERINDSGAYRSFWPPRCRGQPREEYHLKGAKAPRGLRVGLSPSAR